MTPEIITSSGEWFSFEEDTNSTIKILDIAHALSMMCRFGCHSPVFYSVAEHCVLSSSFAVAQGKPRQIQRECLLHDAHEAYTGDMCAPLKRLCPEYQKIEERVQEQVLRHFNIGILSPSVKDIDLGMLKAEHAKFWPDDEARWEGLDKVPAYEGNIYCWSPIVARAQFLRRFLELS